MVISKREKVVFIVTVGLLALLALDRLAISPLLAAMEATQQTRDRLAVDKSNAQTLLSQGRQLAPRWQAMTRAGLKQDRGEAENQVQHVILDWVHETAPGQGPAKLTRLSTNSLPEKTRLPEIAFQVDGTGSLWAVTRLLWHLETADIPIRATEVQISAKEGGSDLIFHLGISTVYAPPPPPSSQPTTASGVRK
jgi:hypothetical protein